MPAMLMLMPMLPVAAATLLPAYAIAAISIRLMPLMLPLLIL